MIRNLKALGLALLAAFALSAVAASGASATEATFSFGSTTGHLEGTGDDQNFIIEFTGNKMELFCPHVEVVTSTSTFEKESVNQITAAPEYNHPNLGSCIEKISKLNTHIDFNGCHYRFKAETDAKGHATVEIQCPAEEEVQISATFLGSPFACVNVPPQSVGGKGNGSGIHYTNTSTGEGEETLTHVDVEATIENEIEFEVTGICGNHPNGKEGDYTGIVPVTAENTAGETVNASYTPAT